MSIKAPELLIHPEWEPRVKRKAAPLCKLLRKDALWEWGPEQDEAVKTLKESVARAPMLVWPCGDRPYVLQLASMGTGLRATLSQHRGALLQPIAHASRLLTPTEQQFTAYEKEVLALIWALQHWEYLVGSAAELVAVTVALENTPADQP
uniref:Reverse transcriptase/retrotransposon-derived protein RNase H-like domain-containing protein n=1 Tax=Meleagris gallopavo TaxID=9103 RepID=A0A803YKN7_MELGA